VNGGRTFAFAQIAGIYGSNFIASRRYPGRYSSSRGGLRWANFSLAGKGDIHLMREFRPEIRRILKR
jgi:hypothetical protein